MEDARRPPSPSPAAPPAPSGPRLPVLRAALAAVLPPLLLAVLASCDGDGDPPRPEPGIAPDLSRADPRFWRETETSLDGPWSFAFDPTGTGLLKSMHRAEGAGEYDRVIEVPFPWNAPLSGVAGDLPADAVPGGAGSDGDAYRGTAWYARDVTVPPGWDPAHRVLLRFGAVSWRATAYVDGQEAGSHEGGHDPFEVDVTAWARPGATFRLALQVEDRCDDDPSALPGLQGPGALPCAGGIWQPVTLLSRPEAHVAAILDLPGEAPGRLVTRVTARGPAGPARLRVTWACSLRVRPYCLDDSGMIPLDLSPGGTAVDVAVDLPAGHEWSPESPALAARTVELFAGDDVDRVRGYLAPRRLRIGAVTASGDGTRPPAGNGVFLNDRLVYLRAALDAGHHPGSLRAVPSVEARREDLQALKDAGFNAVRFHGKAEDPRVLALADLLGLFVLADVPFPPAAPAAPAPGAPWNAAWDRLLEALVARDASHPSLLWWTLFDEARGLGTPGFWTTEEGRDFVRDRHARAKELDPTRPVEDNGATILDGHVRSDLASWHAATPDPSFVEALLDLLEPSMGPGGEGLLHGGGKWSGEPFVNTGFGGFDAGDTRGDHAYAFHGILNALRGRGSLLGYAFRQATDAGGRTDGLRTADRRPKDFGLDELGLDLPDLFGERYLVLGLAPALKVAPGQAVVVPAGFSTPAEARPHTLRWGIRGRTPGLDPFLGGSDDSWRGKVLGPGYTPLGDLSFEADLTPGVFVLEASLTGRVPQEPEEPCGHDGTFCLQADPGEGPPEVEGPVLARNAMYLVVQDAAPPPGEGTAVLERWQGWIDGTGGCSTAGCWCQGDCAISWTLQGLGWGRKRLSLTAEMAPYDPGMPQTDDQPFPGRVEADFYGETVASIELPDAPNDHRGVGTLLADRASLRGAWGRVVTVDLGIRDVGDAVTLRLRALGSGLVVFSRDGGRTLTRPEVRALAD